MSAKRERLANVSLFVNQGDRNCFFVGRRVSRCLEDLTGDFRIMTVDDYRFKSPSAKLLHRQLGISAMLHGDFQVVEHTAQYTNDFLVGTEHERLQSHSLFYGRAGCVTIQVTPVTRNRREESSPTRPCCKSRGELAPCCVSLLTLFVC